MILLIDFGSQTCHLIHRRLRDLGINVKIVEPETAYTKAQELRPRGIVLSGGPASVYDKNSPTLDKRIFNLKIPVLGICYGMQLTAYLIKGQVKAGKNKEFGPATLQTNGQSKLFTGLSQKPFQVWMSHGDLVTRPPAGFEIIASTNDVKTTAMQDERRKIYCVQFHPEVEHTRNGRLILRNFITEICGLKVSNHRLDVPLLIKTLRRHVGKDLAIAAVSGGVDSTVTAALTAKAIKTHLLAVYIDSGLMRSGTKEMVEKIFIKYLKVKPIIVSAHQEFLQVLEGITDPEAKRKAIGALYINLFEKIAKQHPKVRVLIQGTIYSDVIESKGTKYADKIKSHHNVGGLPAKLNLKLVEPLRGLYKDEVRKLGKKLKLPPAFINKQVFPGPGYAIRIIGAVTEKRLQKIQQADNILLEELDKSAWLKKVYMSFPILTGANSTAVKGDGRFFGEVVALRIIESKDVMTSNWSRLPYWLLQKISSRIVNEVPDVSRVVYDITTKPPATMEWE